MSFPDMKKAPSIRSTKLLRAFKSGLGKRDGRRTGTPDSTLAEPISNSKLGDIDFQTELSLSELNIHEGVTGRCLRIYCESAREGSQFKTLFVPSTMLVGKCIDELKLLLFNGESVPANLSLYEVVGSISAVPESRASGRKGPATHDQQSVFQEITSRSLQPDQVLLDVFFLLRPSQGLFRRLELRNTDNCSPASQQSSPDENIPPRAFPPSPLPDKSHGRTRSSKGLGASKTSASPIVSDRRNTLSIRNPVLSPTGPHLLLLKGCMPNHDLLYHDLTKLTSSSSHQSPVTMGFISEADIQMFRPSDNPQLPKEKTTGIIGLLFSKDYGFDTKPNIPNVWIKLSETWSDKSVRLFVNDEPLTSTSAAIQLQPGNLIKIEASPRGYTFMFNDPRVKSNDLTLDFNSTQATLSGNSVSGRSAGRTARIAASRSLRNTVDSMKPTIMPLKLIVSEILPHASSVRTLIGSLIPEPRIDNAGKRSVNLKMALSTKVWNTSGSAIPGPSLAAALISQLVRSTASLYRPTRATSEYHSGHMTLEAERITAILESVNLEVKIKLADLKSNSSNCLLSTLWVSTFSYYLSLYLFSGWLSPAICEGLAIEDLVNTIESGSESTFSSDSDRPVSELEQLEQVKTLYKFVFAYGDQAMDASVKVVAQVVLPYLSSFCQQLSGSIDDPAGIELSQIKKDLLAQLDRVLVCYTAAGMYRGTRSPLSSKSVSEMTPFTETPRSRRQSKSSLSHDCSRLDSSSSSNAPLPIDSMPYADTAYDSDVDGLNSSADCPFIDPPRRSGPGISRIQISSDIGSSNVEETGSSSSSGVSTGSQMTTQNSISPAQTRLESVFWRRCLAVISHDILQTIASDAEIPINRETGVQLFSLVDAISQWLKSKRLDRYRDPMKVLTDFANLLATPRDQLYKMSHQAMRNTYPDVPDYMLDFLRENYEEGRGFQDSPVWNKEQNSYSAAIIGPAEEIARLLNKWHSRQRLMPPGYGHRNPVSMQGPRYRPTDLASMFKVSNTMEFILALDQSIEDENFTWKKLLLYFPPSAALTKPIPAANNLLPPTMPRSRLNSAVIDVNQSHNFRRPRRRSSRAAELNGRSRSANRVERGYESNSYPDDQESVFGGNRFGTTFMQPKQSARNPEFSYQTWGARTGQPRIPVAVSAVFGDRSNGGFRQGLSSARSELGGCGYLNNNGIYNRSPASARRQYGGTLGRKINRPDFYDNPNAPLQFDDFSRIGDVRASHDSLLWQARRAQPKQPTLDNWGHGQFNNDSIQRYVSAVNLSHTGACDSAEFSRFKPYETEWARIRTMMSRNQTPSQGSQRYVTPSSAYGSSPYLVDIPIDNEGVNTAGSFASTRGFGSMCTLGLATPTNPSYNLCGRCGSAGLLGSHQLDDDNSDIENIDKNPSGRTSPRLEDDAGFVRPCAPPETNIINVSLSRSEKGSFGITLVDGARTSLDQPGVFVKSVTAGEPADKSGQIGMGDQILAINAKALSGLTYRDAMEHLKSTGSQAAFTIQKCRLADPTSLLVTRSS